MIVAACSCQGSDTFSVSVIVREHVLRTIQLMQNDDRMYNLVGFIADEGTRRFTLSSTRNAEGGDYVLNKTWAILGNTSPSDSTVSFWPDHPDQYFKAYLSSFPALTLECPFCE